MLFVGIVACVVSGIGIIQIMADKYTKTPKDENIMIDTDPYDIDEICDDNDNINKAKLRLTKSLKTLCKQLHINLDYYDYVMEDNVLGCIWPGFVFDNITLGKVKIAILEAYRNEPLVLAHELGHYMAIKQRKDTSELGADREALKLCKSILTPEEFKILEVYLLNKFTRYENKSA